MDETGKEDSRPIQRLCSEIQLFDLCDRESCGHKEGRYCTSQDLLDRFEQISEDDKPPVGSYMDEETDDDMEADYDDSLGVDDLDDERDDWEDG
jgi:hypothetical protein